MKTQPIRNTSDIQRLKEYFINRHEWRDYTLFVLGINTALRIGDIISLKWKDVYDFKENKYKKHIYIVEQKTKKMAAPALNNNTIACLNLLREKLGQVQPIQPEEYILKSRKGNNCPIGRNRAYTVIKRASDMLGIEGNISCHSLRKTFGYHAWKQGIPPALIMDLFNHSSIEITKRYLSIDQDERDSVYLSIEL